MNTQEVAQVHEIQTIPESVGDEGHGTPEWASHPLSFTIRAASTHGLRSKANVLVQRRYEWRGYACGQNDAEIDTQSAKATLVAIDKGKTIGTLTVGFDADGFAAEQIFKDEIDGVRQRGLSLCEFTSLAVEEPICSKEVLASLFHTAYIYAHRLHGAQAVLIEVNPRHVGFYQTVLSFKQLGELRTNQKVNAPSALLMLEFDSVQEVLQRILRGDLGSVPKRSYYPFFFPKHEEEGIVSRLEKARAESVASHFQYPKESPSVSRFVSGHQRA